jgi:hypothetical protein
MVAFTTQPSASPTSNTAFAVQPVVTVQYPDGATVTTDTSSISLALTAANGATLSCANNPLAASGGVATFNGCKIDKAGTYTLTASDGTLTAAVSSSITISAGAAAKLGFVQGPSDAYVGSAMTPAVTVQVQDQFGNAVSLNNVSVTLSPSAGTISGGTTTTNSAGLASFSGLIFTATALGVTLSVSATGLSAATSSAFNVTVKVTTASAALTDTASDTGAGVKSVSYYYCSGYAGPCPSGTLIGTSTTSAGGYPITWTGQPANGPYRVVAVGIDNVNNTSVASASIPVTVAN